jgi:tRNA pseudouridine65 synthase
MKNNNDDKIAVSVSDKDKNPWTCLETRLVYSNNWITVEEDQVLTPSGTPGIYGKVKPRGKAVGVVALDDTGNIYLVGQYRYMLDEYSWEIPEGASNPGEDPLDTAKRELKEETGLEAGEWKFLMRLHTSNSFTDEEAFIFIARNLSQKTPEPDDNECIEVKKIPFRNALNMVIKGEITDAMSVCAILKCSALKLDSKRVEIIYEDDCCVAVNKPPGLMVHKNSSSRDTEFLLQILRNQINTMVYPLHRLDRPTSGIVLFTKDSDLTGVFSELFSNRKIKKTYYAVVRGYTDDCGIIDSPLKHTSKLDCMQDAVTEYETIARTELDIPLPPYSTVRYSMLKIVIKTGRTHQIRRHFAHLRHPVIGDTTYGDRHHNRLFRDKLHCSRLLLHAAELEFRHPVSGQMIKIQAPLCEEFSKILDLLNFNNPFQKV